jgi:hypothetical protein
MWRGVGVAYPATSTKYSHDSKIILCIEHEMEMPGSAKTSVESGGAKVADRPFRGGRDG